MITKQELHKHIAATNGGADRRFLSLIEASNEYELCDSRNFAGHLTVSAVVVHLTSRMMLMVHNEALDEWCVPGGHVDWDDQSIVSAAMRHTQQQFDLKAEELVAINVVGGEHLCAQICSRLINTTLDGSELEHWHHDLCFVFGYHEIEGGGNWVSLDDPKASNIFNPISLDHLIINQLKAIEIATQEQNPSDYLTTRIAWYELCVANSLWDRKQIEQAEQLYLHSIHLFEHTYSEEFETPPTILIAMWNLASIYIDTDRPEQAIELLEKGLELAQMYAAWEERYENWVTDLSTTIKGLQQ